MTSIGIRVSRAQVPDEAPFYRSRSSDQDSLISCLGSVRFWQLRPIYMKVIAKYPIKIGDVLVPKDAVGETVGMTDRMRKHFPGMELKEESPHALVLFPEVGVECLVPKRQLIYDKQ